MLKYSFHYIVMASLRLLDAQYCTRIYGSYQVSLVLAFFIWLNFWEFSIIRRNEQYIVNSHFLLILFHNYLPTKTLLHVFPLLPPLPFNHSLQDSSQTNLRISCMLSFVLNLGFIITWSNKGYRFIPKYSGMFL